MKKSLLFVVIPCSLLGACGSDQSITGADSSVLDGPVPDAPVGPTVDAPVDPPVDAPAPLPPTVWVLGDTLENNRYQVVRHVHGDPLPVTPGVVVPGGALAELPPDFGDGSFGAFDVSADGTRIAFAADIGEATRFDLYVADFNGGNVVRIATMPAAGDVDRVVLSPDGRLVAFRADYEVEGRKDIYVLPTDGAVATPRRITPDRAADTTLNAALIAWAPDSKSVLITGDFTALDYRELWRVDLTTDPLTREALVDRDRIMATSAGPKGVLGPVYHTAGGRVLMKTRMDPDNAYKLHIADGQNLDVLPSSEIARDDKSIADIGGVGLSGDGTMLAFAADPVLDAYEIYVLRIGGAEAAQRITSGSAIAGRGPHVTSPLQWSPDGSRIAFLADYWLDSKFDPYVVPAAGGTEQRLAGIGLATDANRDADALVWTTDGDALYATADHRVGNDVEVFMLDPTQTDQEPTLVIGVPVNGDVGGVRVSVTPGLE